MTWPYAYGEAGMPKEICADLKHKEWLGFASDFKNFPVNAVKACILRSCPEITFPPRGRRKNVAYLRMIYEGALRQGFATRKQRAQLLMDDLGI